MLHNFTHQRRVDLLAAFSLLGCYPSLVRAKAPATQLPIP
jgi:hypothetical protein